MVHADPLEAEATADDNFDDDNLSEEDETQLLGGEGFSPEQLAAAEKRFEEQMVGNSIIIIYKIYKITYNNITIYICITESALHGKHQTEMEEAINRSGEGEVQHPGNCAFHYVAN